jgi:hypothetical protein
MVFRFSNCPCLRAPPTDEIAGVEPKQWTDENTPGIPTDARRVVVAAARISNLFARFVNIEVSSLSRERVLFLENANANV